MSNGSAPDLLPSMQEGTALPPGLRGVWSRRQVHTTRGELLALGPGQGNYSGKTEEQSEPVESSTSQEYWPSAPHFWMSGGVLWRDGGWAGVLCHSCFPLLTAPPASRLLTHSVPDCSLHYASHSSKFFSGLPPCYRPCVFLTCLWSLIPRLPANHLYP